MTAPSSPHGRTGRGANRLPFYGIDSGAGPGGRPGGKASPVPTFQDLAAAHAPHTPMPIFGPAGARGLTPGGLLD